MAIFSSDVSAETNISNATTIANNALRAVTIGVFQKSAIDQTANIDKIDIENVKDSSIELNITATIDSSQITKLMSNSEQDLQTSVVNQLSSLMDIQTESKNSFAAGEGLAGAAGGASFGPLFASSDVRNIMNNAMNLSSTMSNIVNQTVSNTSEINQFLNVPDGIDINNVSNSQVKLNLTGSIKSTQNTDINNQDVQKSLLKLDQSLSASTKTSVPSSMMFWLMVGGLFLVTTGSFFKGKKTDGDDGGGDEEKKWTAKRIASTTFKGILVCLCLYFVYKIFTCRHNFGKCWINMFGSIFKSTGKGLTKMFNV